MIRYLRFALYAPATAQGTTASHLERIEALFGVIDIAHKAMNARTPLNTNQEIPVFVAPEWYFQRRATGGLNYAYDYMDFNEILLGLKKNCDAYPDCLIVPGSILWYMQGPIVYNTVAAFYKRKMYIYHKQVEGNDVRRTAREKKQAVFGFLDPAESAHHVKRAGGKVIFKPEDLEGIFEAGTVRFGIEVCADHGPATLLKAVFPNTYQISTVDRQILGLDLHILIACGATPLQANIATKHDGCFAYVDGSRPMALDRRAHVYCGVSRRASGDINDANVQLSPKYDRANLGHHQELHEVPFKGKFKTLFISNRIRVPQLLPLHGRQRSKTI